MSQRVESDSNFSSLRYSRQRVSPVAITGIVKEASTHSRVRSLRYFSRSAFARISSGVSSLVSTLGSFLRASASAASAFAPSFPSGDPITRVVGSSVSAFLGLALRKEVFKERSSCFSRRWCPEFCDHCVGDSIHEFVFAFIDKLLAAVGAEFPSALVFVLTFWIWHTPPSFFSRCVRASGPLPLLRTFVRGRLA